MCMNGITKTVEITIDQVTIFTVVKNVIMRQGQELTYCSIRKITMGTCMIVTTVITELLYKMKLSTTNSK